MFWLAEQQKVENEQKKRTQQESTVEVLEQQSKISKEKVNGQIAGFECNTINLVNF